MKRVLVLSSALASVGFAAQAGNFDPAPAEPVVAAPVAVAPAPLPDWSGGYVGAQLGYGMGDVDDGTTSTDFDGFLGGLHAGYRQDFGSWVLGGEIDYNIADLQLDGDAGEIDEVARLKLQAGYDLGRALVYGTVGAAYAGADIGGASLSDNGWAAGVGVDYLVTDNITVGAEYLYHDFSDFDDSGSDVTANTLQARVAYKF